MILKYAAVIIKNKKLLLVRKKRSHIFLSPGGKPYENETPEECLIREIQEELGCSSKVMEFISEYTGISALESCKIKMLSYYVQLDGSPVPSKEIEEIKWVGSDKINMIQIGSIFSDHIIPMLIGLKKIK